MTAATITSSQRYHPAAALKAEAQRLLDACHVPAQPPWVHRTVSNYLRYVEHTGFPFGAYLLNRVQLNAEQRRRAMQDPELHNFLCYSDPTGETAVRNVMRAKP